MNKKNIRIFIVIVFVIASIGKSIAQSVIFAENFNSGGGGWLLNTSDEGSTPGSDNAWVVNNSYAGFPGFVGDTPNQPATITGFPQSNYLHIHNLTLSGLFSNANFAAPADEEVFVKMNNSISTVGFTNVNLKFHYLCKGDDNVNDAYFGKLFYSTNGGTTWIESTTTYSQIANWTQTTVTNPAFDNQLNLRFAFQWVQNSANASAAADPSFSIDEIVVEGTAGASATITTGVLPNATVCPGATFNVPFTSDGTFIAGNLFTAQLSDANGNFNPINPIGSSAASPVPVTIPGGTPTGSGYLIRIVSSDPVLTGSASVTTLTVNASQALSVSLTADATSVCPGTTVNFTATPGQTLTNATYAWSVGGVNQAGQTTSTLSAPITTNPTIVQVTLATTDACFNPTTASANISISTAGQPLTVSITASEDTICSGDNVTFVATTSPAILTNATYTWFVNDIQQQTGASPTFSTVSLTGLSAIKVVVSSTDVCLSDPSDEDVVQVLQQSTPLAVTITVFPNNNPCPGAPLTFSANVTPAGLTGLTYQWLNNGNPIPGEVLDTLNTSTYADGDIITVEVATNDPCVTGSPALSNIITITFSSGPEASVTATASQLQVCSGTPVTFTASPVNGGVNPIYTWLIDGEVVGSNSPTFVATGLQVTAGMLVQVVMQSSETCVSNNPDTANVTITVIQKVQPTAVLNETIKLCANSGGRIIATISPSGGTLNWTVNGFPTPTTGLSFFTQSVNDGDTIRLYHENIPGCVFVDSLASNIIVVQLNNPPIIELGDDLTITYGDEVQLSASVTPVNSIFSWAPTNYLSCATPGTNCLNPFANPTDTSNLLVLVAADPTTGCTNSDSLVIRVKTNYDIFIPTAFSPNGDGNNDVLYVRNPPNQFKSGRFLFRIYNEYGEKVFETEYKEFGWDGKYRDKFALPGVYIYHLTGLYADDKPIDQKGKFLLMK
jgi:gliding motility-associated-like protein